MTRMSFSDAKRLLDAYCMEVDGKPASTNKNPSTKRNEEGKKKDWWLEKIGNNHVALGPRPLAYLKAYDQIASLDGTSIFYATGISLVGGLMQPDRGVMKTLLEAGYVTLDEKRGLFSISSEGHAAISQI